MSDALQNISLRWDLNPGDIEGIIMDFLQHPDVAGCDCDELPDGSRAYFNVGEGDMVTCDRCVVARVPDKDGIEARVRKVLLLAFRQIRLPAVGVETDE